jgi:trk system potassium uptake protein TrkH
MWARRSVLEMLWERPARLVSVSFLATALIGAIILSLPAATIAPGGLPFLDAFFTATSAVCVTGLIVVDTATAYTPLGLVTILALIQIGGLGIMAFAVSTIYLVRRRLTMDEAELLSFMLNEKNRHTVAHQLRSVIGLTFGIEALGALFLTLAWWPTAGSFARAAWWGTFHAVSAFCNAGFALFSDSLESFVHNPLVNLTVMGLIMAGGIGFGTFLAIRGVSADDSTDATDLSYQPIILARRRRRVFFLRSPGVIAARVAVVGTAILVGIGAFLFYVVEARNSLLGMTLPQKYLAALFQSVTYRTAGFNSISFGSVHRATLLLALPLMFIGGASGGTAGGVKIGTAAALWAEFRRFFLHRRDAVLMGRRLPGRLITQATVLVVAGVVAVLIATTILSVTETAPVEMILFEVVSALGTVGLSAGLTGDLSAPGRVVVILLMLIGRLGPLTLFAAFRPESRAADFRYPEGEIPIG